MTHLDHCIQCQSTSFDSLLKSRVQMHPSTEEFNFDRCNDCGLVFLNPRVDPTELGQYYTDYYLPYRGEKAWGKHAEMVEKDQRKLDQRRVNFLSKYVALDANSKVLDLGCGKPTFLEALQKDHGSECMGIDFSDSGWKDDLKRFGHLDLRVGQLEHVPKEWAPDAISMWHYLEHDYAPDQTLRDLRSIAKPSTKLILEVPNHASMSRKKFGSQWAGYHTPRHTFLFNPETITQMLDKAGWKYLEVDTQGTLDPYNLFWMSRAEKRSIDWSKSMESEFVRYVVGMLAFKVRKVFSLPQPWGIMTIVAEPK